MNLLLKAPHIPPCWYLETNGEREPVQLQLAGATHCPTTRLIEWMNVREEEERGDNYIKQNRSNPRWQPPSRTFETRPEQRIFGNIRGIAGGPSRLRKVESRVSHWLAPLMLLALRWGSSCWNRWMVTCLPTHPHASSWMMEIIIRMRMDTNPNSLYSVWCLASCMTCYHNLLTANTFPALAPSLSAQNREENQKKKIDFI